MFGHSLDSFILQIENLEKSLRDTSGSSAASISSRTRQVRELSDEVGIVDRELAAVAVEREETSRRLNSKRMNHIATLRELGEYFTCLLPSSWPNLLEILTWDDGGRVPKSERGLARRDTYIQQNPFFCGYAIQGLPRQNNHKRESRRRRRTHHALIS